MSEPSSQPALVSRSKQTLCFFISFAPQGNDWHGKLWNEEKSISDHQERLGRGFVQGLHMQTGQQAWPHCCQHYVKTKMRRYLFNTSNVKDRFLFVCHIITLPYPPPQQLSLHLRPTSSWHSSSALCWWSLYQPWSVSRSKSKSPFSSAILSAATEAAQVLSCSFFADTFSAGRIMKRPRRLMSAFVSCHRRLRWKELRCLSDVLPGWRGRDSRWTWQTVVNECFGGGVWLQPLPGWSWRFTGKRWVFQGCTTRVTLCSFTTTRPLLAAVAEAVLECIEKSRTVVLVPTASEPSLGSGLLSAIHEALVERQTRLVFIRTEAAGVSGSGSVPEAFQLLCEAANCVTWRGTSSRSTSSSFWKRLRYYLPAPGSPCRNMLTLQSLQ